MQDAVVFPSAWLQTAVIERDWILPENNRVIQNVPPKWLLDLQQLPSQSSNTPTIVQELVFFGRLSVLKGLIVFCDAVDMLLMQLDPEISKNLLVTFLGSDQMIEGVRASKYIAMRSNKWPIKVSVITDFGPSKAINYLRDGPKLAVMPSIVDASPYAVLECLYAGVPFVATNNPGTVSLIRESDRDHTIVPNGNLNALTNRLVRVVIHGAKSAQPYVSSQAVKSQWVKFHSERLQVNYQLSQLTLRGATSHPLVSVIITHYNRHGLLKQAIQSLESQTYNNFEVILIDDGSTDPASIKYVQYLSKIWRKKGWSVVQTENRYVGAARNTGAKLAAGKYVLFMDDDDYAKPHQIQMMVYAAENTNANIVTTGHDLLQGNNPPSSLSKIDLRYIPLGSATKVGLIDNCFGDSNMFVLRSFFHSIGGFTEDYGVGFEDYEFLAKVSLAGEIIQVVSDPLHWYRKHGESMSSQTDQSKNEARFLRAYSDSGAEIQALAKQIQVNRNRRALGGLLTAIDYRHFLMII